MHVQAGRFRGRRIRDLPSRDIRPCTGRVKKSLFDTLGARMDFEEIDVLDLFAGFGSLGFEVLSRGAGSVTFVEQNRAALDTMKATATDLGVGEMVRFVQSDVTLFLEREQRQYDLVFCDPPYRWEGYELLIERIASGGVLAEEGLLVMEHHAILDFSTSNSYLFHKDYGSTRVSFFKAGRST
jgi:16S rRNA (guanine966-N2)-methyltransferase